jgi:adenylosuccinate synthase
MPATVLIGTQWGDEGKGKITDILAASADAVVRFQGGNNAGHTIVIGGEVYKLHMIPSGVFREGQKAVIGDGCVVDPWVLRKELDGLSSRGIDTSNVVLSDRAHLIMPYHRKLDGLQESSKEDGRKVGTTKRGIGPCYQDKAARIGIRVGDLRYPDILREKLQQAVWNANRMMSAFGSKDEPFDKKEILNELIEISGSILPHVRDVPQLLHELLNQEGNILLEGAQGAFLDIDRGTYPFVTSSSCSAGNGCSGSGLGPLDVERVVGVMKAYTTRVGEGPFPTELNNQIGQMIQRRGHEIGTTTERPRRCGWLDLVMVRSSIRWNSITEIAMTKIDVLSGLDPIMVCTEYRIPQEVAELHGIGTTLRHFPSHLEILAQASPVYIKMHGWKDMDNDDWMEAKEEQEFPKRVQDYIDLVEREVLANVVILSFGKGREETMFLSGEEL